MPNFARSLVTALLLTLSPAAADPMLERAMDAVLVVATADPAAQFLGSAFLWAEAPGLAVTAAHVVEDAAEVRLTDLAGREHLGRVIARDIRRDVALIAVSGGPGLASGQPPEIGDPVWAIGAPLGLGFTLTGGHVSALARQVEPAVPLRLLQHDAAVNPGSSGGPLLDATGRLIGMNSRIADGSRVFLGVAYALPLADLRRIVAGLAAGTLPPLPDLGLTARPLDRQIAAALQVAEGGLLVDAVEPGGLAALSGVMAGDVLVAVAGERLREPGDLAFALESAPSPHADLTLLRRGKTLHLSLDLRQPATEPPPPPPPPAPLTLNDLGLHLAPDGLVETVRPTSPAAAAGVQPGEHILAINGTDLPDPGALFHAPILLLLQNAHVTRHILLDPHATEPAFHPVAGANVLDPASLEF